MITNKTNDIDLINTIKNGEYFQTQRAFNILFDKYNKSLLYRYKGFVNNNEDIAQEIVLDAFLKMQMNIDKFNEENAAFSTWFFNLTKNIFIDYLRKQKQNVITVTEINEVHNDDENEGFQFVYNGHNPEQELLNKEKNKVLFTVINKVDDDSINIIKMRYYKGLSYNEISKQLSIPVGTVKGKLFRVRILLRQKFTAAHLYKMRSDSKKLFKTTHL